MTTRSNRMLFWVPRVLSMAFIAFVSLFALDVFSDHLGFRETVVALAVHLIPSLALVVILVAAWHREWVGTVLYGGAGALYVLTILPRQQPPVAIKLVWCATIAGPAFAIAALFWLNWLKHDELRGGR